jgi:hypothetical protein
LKKSLLPEHVTYNGTVITAPAGWLPKPKPQETQKAQFLYQEFRIARQLMAVYHRV